MEVSSDMVTDRVVILGACPSKSNSYKIITIRGHASLGKTPALKNYERSFFLQNSLRNLNITGKFALDVDVFYASDRPDLDNALKIILDCLQQCHTIKNDRNCVEISARKFVDKANPRISFKITQQF